MNSALATRNLLDAFLEVGKPKRFVNVSSFAVYSNLSLKHNSLLDETCPLETASQERFDAYGFGKLKQEEIVREYAKHYRLPCVTLRPGYVFGAGKQELNGRVGIKIFGPFIQVNGSNLLPLTYVDNCAEAIVLAGLTPGIDGEVFNIVDDDLLTARQFLKTYKVARRFRSVSVPYWVAYSACYAWEKYSKWSKGQLPPAFNRRRCAAEVEESALLERETQNTTGLEATCADEASDGNIPCAVRNKRRGLISNQNASCHNSRLRQDCRPACTRHPANSGLQHRRSLRSGTSHGAAACRAFQNPGVFSNAQEMLKAVSPDVVHITTPPQSHYTLARECLESGSHVYLEKPFTITAKRRNH